MGTEIESTEDAAVVLHWVPKLLYPPEELVTGLLLNKPVIPDVPVNVRDTGEAELYAATDTCTFPTEP